jgi:hypothetical protein
VNHNRYAVFSKSDIKLDPICAVVKRACECRQRVLWCEGCSATMAND